MNRRSNYPLKWNPSDHVHCPFIKKGSEGNKYFKKVEGQNMNDLRIFKNSEFGKLSVATSKGEIYFFLGEVCYSLGYTKMAKGKVYLRKDKIVNICKSLEIKGLSPSDNYETVTLDTDFDVMRITEDNLYDLILESKAKNARKFRKWITTEVIPQIRQTGGYIPIEEDEPIEVFLARAVKIANETINKKDEIIANQKKRIKLLEETEKDWKLLMDCKGTFSVNEMLILLVLVNINYLQD